MSLYIKPGFWIEKKKYIKGFFNLDQFIDEKITAIPPPSGVEVLVNKQDSLAVDGTGTKYPTIDVVNEALGDIESILLSI
jgi:hypothetical protein